MSPHRENGRDPFVELDELRKRIEALETQPPEVPPIAPRVLRELWRYRTWVSWYMAMAFGVGAAVRAYGIMGLLVSVPAALITTAVITATPPRT